MVNMLAFSVNYR